jgi:hypothetical protein
MTFFFLSRFKQALGLLPVFSCFSVRGSSTRVKGEGPSTSKLFTDSEPECVRGVSTRVKEEGAEGFLERVGAVGCFAAMNVARKQSREDKKLPLRDLFLELCSLVKQCGSQSSRLASFGFLISLVAAEHHASDQHAALGPLLHVAKFPHKFTGAQMHSKIKTPHETIFTQPHVEAIVEKGIRSFSQDCPDRSSYD